jgi:hypothetical protein
MAKYILSSLSVFFLLILSPECRVSAADIGPLATQAGFASVADGEAKAAWCSYQDAACEPQACDGGCQAEACCDSDCCGCGDCGACCGPDPLRRCCRALHRLHRCLNSTCDMPPHYPYFPPMHGYYYFRPYHHSHLASQQDFVASWGGDPRNPYANEIFQRVYAEYRADKGAPLEPLTPAPRQQ